MDIEIELHHREIHLSRNEQALARAALKRKIMKNEFQARLAMKVTPYSSRGHIRVLTSTLGRMIEKYSEQLLCQPLEEMTFWFDYRSGSFLAPGYAPLYYKGTNSKDRPSPNKSVIGGIGEGVAGLVMQRLYKAIRLARPIHDYPDAVMFVGDKTYLTEAKATTQSVESIHSIINGELVDMILYASACRELDASRTVVGTLIGTALLANDKYKTYITEVLL